MPSRLVDDSGHYDECLDQALDAMGHDGLASPSSGAAAAPTSRQIGIGIACYNELTGLGRAAVAGPRMPFRTGHDACTVRINPDGRVTVFSGVTSQGQGLETTIAQIVADGLGVALRRRRGPDRRHRRVAVGLRRVLVAAGGDRWRGGAPHRARPSRTRSSRSRPG